MLDYGVMMQETLRQQPSFILTPLTAIPSREFETARLRFRALQHGDGQLLFDLYANDVNICRYMSFKVDGKVETSEGFVRLVVDSFAGRHNGKAMFSWLLQLKETGEYIGSAGFEASDETKVTGGYILNPKFWGVGYATEAWKRLLEVAQADPGVHRIEAYHHPDNPASGKVMQAAGMTYAGIRTKGAVFPNISDEKADEVVYAWNRAE
jgi:ribosomal-protein-alanine N-acetyltransferase